MPFSGSIQGTISAVEDVPAGSTLLQGVPQATHTLPGLAATMTSGTAVPGTKASSFETTLSSGAATIDLTSLAGVAGQTVNLTGLKVQAIAILADSTNTAGLAIVGGATNGIDLFGSSGKVVIPPGGWFQMFFKEGAPDVASGDRTLDLSSAHATAKAKFLIIAG